MNVSPNATVNKDQQGARSPDAELLVVFLNTLRSSLPDDAIITDKQKILPFARGWREGYGQAHVVVKPKRLTSYWRCLQICNEFKAVIILQAANTGLTGGSTPNGHYDERIVVIINTLALNSVYISDDAKTALCLPGTTLHQLETELAKRGRMPHSVIGSSGLGATVIGGIANNSGGALVKRGPAYTQRALFAQIDETGTLRLNNHLGIQFATSEPDEVHTLLSMLDNGNLPPNWHHPRVDDRWRKGSASAVYQQRIRDTQESTPARYNANPECLYEASGCAGKLAVFAVCVDTFAPPQRQTTFFIASKIADPLAQIRKQMLEWGHELPEYAEYFDRSTHDITKRYGKDTFLLIKYLGTKRLPALFALKNRLERWLARCLPAHQTLIEGAMQWLSERLPEHLPERITQMTEENQHFLILTTADRLTEPARLLLNNQAKEQTLSVIECTEDERSALLLHRFAAAGAAVKYQTIHSDRVQEVLALDIALPRNCENFTEQLPAKLCEQIEQRMYYGHLFCHVLHQDYLLKVDANLDEIKRELLKLLQQRGAKYPAEHNVGHLYDAEPQLKAFYAELDPTNSFNPGIGGTKKQHRTRFGCC